MKKARMLKTIKIGGINYKIVYPYVFKENSGLVGLHEPNIAKIKLSDSFARTKRSWDRILETLLHEIIHGVDVVYTNAGLSEEEVSILSVCLFQVIRDNDLNIEKCKFPANVKIGGFNYKVIENYSFKDTECQSGTIYHQACEILCYFKDVNGDDYAGSVKMSTFFYFVMKAIINITELGNILSSDNVLDGSQLQGTFAQGLYQVFSDNKDLEKLLKSDGELK